MDSVPSTIILSPRNHLITEAACHLIANSLSAKEAVALRGATTEPFWRRVIFHGLKSRDGNVQEAAAAAMRSLSRLRDCSEDCQRRVTILAYSSFLFQSCSLHLRLVKEFKRGSGIMQQSLGRVLGVFDYLSFNNGLDEALPCLLDVVSPKV